MSHCCADVVGSTPHPDEGFMRQVGRTLTATDEGVLVGHRVLICDRDAKWSAPVRGVWCVARAFCTSV